MKKTFIALMALVGMAMASDFSSSITMGNAAGNGNYYGGTVKLTDYFFSTSFSSKEVTELYNLHRVDCAFIPQLLLIE